MSSRSLCIAAVLTSSASAFTVVPVQKSMSTTALEMGLFDGVKDAFAAPPIERSSLDAERETPIDRWMGWSVKSENEQQAQEGE